MISVLVADDSALVRRLISGVLDAAPDIEVVGIARHGAEAIEKVGKLRPDLLTLDIEMPVMNGLAAMRKLHQQFPSLPVIMVSTLTEKGAAITLDALTAGARDYVTKPTNSASLKDSLGDLSDQLLPRVRALTAKKRRPAPPRTGPARPPAPAQPPARSATPVDTQARPHVRRAPQIVALGSSTGGPDALAQVLTSITERPPVPIVAVQHMPPVFTGLLASRLGQLGPVEVVEAADGQQLVPGVMYLAPGGRHLEVRNHGPVVKTVINDDPPENYSKPSVDVLFRSVAKVYPGSAVGVVLTGMGHDGRDGCLAMHAGGSIIAAQDQASSVVWGMPRAVAEAGAADAVLDLGSVGSYLVEQWRASTRDQRSATGVA